MDYINRIRSTVTNVIPGNSVTKEYDIKNQTGSGGPGLIWKFFDACKKSTKESASVWLLERRLLEMYSKVERDKLFDLFKKAVSTLTRLRHPQILQVQHPLEESRDCLAFATEPIFASLANVLGNYTNVVDEGNAKQALQEYEIFDLERKYGFLQISEAIAFLHKDCQRVHMNISPSSIIILKSGSWKLAGFDFSCLINQQTPYCFVNTEMPKIGRPLLNYLPPEIVLRADNEVTNAASDIFSMACLVYTVFNKGDSCIGAYDDVANYKESLRKVNNSSVSNLHCIPEQLRDCLKLMLNVDPTIRPDAHQFSKIQYFNDPGVSVLLNMDNLYQLDNLAKSQFYKTLPQIVPTLPKRTCVHRVFQQIAEEFNNKNMIPFVLPSVLHIADKCSKQEFADYLLPKLKTVFYMDEPVQISLVILQNLAVIVSKCPENDFKLHVSPMIARALTTENSQIQELCLRSLPAVAHLLDHNMLKNSLMPRLKTLLIGANHKHLKAKVLVCIGQLMEHMDRWFVLDDVLPVMQQLKTRDPAVSMGVLGIYKIAYSHAKLGIPKDHLATRIVPVLLPMAIDTNLNPAQFENFMSLIRDMMTRIEIEHRSKLEQLYQLERETSSIQVEKMSNAFQTKVGPVSVPTAPDTIMDSIMSTFGFDNFSADMTRTVPDVGKGVPVRALDTSASGSINSDNYMSMQDKRRKALAREQAMFVGNETMKPMQATKWDSQGSRRNEATTKDLTSTLLETNLQVLSTTKSNKPNYPMNAMLGTKAWDSHFVTPFQTGAGSQNMFKPSETMYGDCQPMASLQNVSSTGSPLLVSHPKQLDKVCALNQQEINELLG